MPRFYVDAALRAGMSHWLAEEASHHAVHVLRARTGDEVTLFNGRGGEYAGRIAAIERRRMLVDVLEHRAVEREAPLRLVLVQGVSSGERMDFTVRKAVELGVAEIHPVLARYSGGEGSRILLSPTAELRFSQACKSADGTFTIAAGPEAGFSAEEERAF